MSYNFFHIIGNGRYHYFVKTTHAKFSPFPPTISLSTAYAKQLPIRSQAGTTKYQAVCVTTHKGSWVKLLLSLISIVTRSTSHFEKER